MKVKQAKKLMKAGVDVYYFDGLACYRCWFNNVDGKFYSVDLVNEVSDEIDILWLCDNKDEWMVARDLIEKLVYERNQQ